MPGTLIAGEDLHSGFYEPEDGVDLTFIGIVDQSGQPREGLFHPGEFQAETRAGEQEIEDDLGPVRQMDICIVLIKVMPKNYGDLKQITRLVEAL